MRGVAEFWDSHSQPYLLVLCGYLPSGASSRENCQFHPELIPIQGSMLMVFQFSLHFEFLWVSQVVENQQLKRLWFVSRYYIECRMAAFWILTGWKSTGLFPSSSFGFSGSRIFNPVNPLPPQQRPPTPPFFSLSVINSIFMWAWEMMLCYHSKLKPLYF